RHRARAPRRNSDARRVRGSRRSPARRAQSKLSLGAFRASLPATHEKRSFSVSSFDSDVRPGRRATTARAGRFAVRIAPIRIAPAGTEYSATEYSRAARQSARFARAGQFARTEYSATEYSGRTEYSGPGADAGPGIAG